MFEKYTERAKRAVYFARQSALRLSSPAIDAGHLLLGLVREDPELFEILSPESKGHLDDIRRNIESSYDEQPKGRASTDLPLSRTGKKIVEIAGDQSLRNNQSYIGTEHLLLAILIADDYYAMNWLIRFVSVPLTTSRVLLQYGFDAKQVAERVSKGSLTPQTRTTSSTKDENP